MKRQTIRAGRLALVTLLLSLTAVPAARAAEFRRFIPIPTPGGPAAATAPAAAAAVPMQTIRAAVTKLVEAWNAKAIEGALAKDFYDRFNLADAMADKVPRDARLEVLSIQGFRTLGQHREETAQGRERVSLVSVTVRTQIVYDDPAAGYQRREGTNELVFRIRQALPSPGAMNQ